MKVTHARIFVFATLLALAASGATTAHAVRPTPAYQGGKSQQAPRAPDALSSNAHSLNDYQRARLARITGHAGYVLAPGSSDTLRVAVFQVQFTDSLMGGQPGSNRPQLRDSTWFGNELTHVAQYFKGASRNRFVFKPTLDGTLYTLSKKMSYYGSDANEDTRVVELAQEVINLVDDSVDFSQFDHVMIIHAGAGQETDVNGDSPIQIWSSFYDRSDIRRAQKAPASPGLPTNDMRNGQPVFVDNFSIVPSHASQDYATVGTLGIWTYQIGNRIGLVPLFDSTPSGAPDSQGVGNFCLMGYGLFDVNGFVPAFPCAFNRVLAGWVDPVVVDAEPASVAVRLADINTGSDADTVCIKVPITENEYYLVDNRVHDTNADSLFTFHDDNMDLIPQNDESLDGAEFDFFLTDLSNPYTSRYDPDYGFTVLFRRTGSGMYIWHVDEQVIRDAVQQGYLPDDYVNRKGVDLEEADGVQDMDRPGPAAFSLGSYFDSFRVGDGNHSVFGPATKPNSASNSGAATGIEIATTSAPGPFMRVTVRRQLPYDDVRVRWAAASPGQAATPVDLDNDGNLEIVTLSDSAGVFVFNSDGTEWNDADNNPATIEPYIAVPGVRWAGPPAFANLDAAPDIEIVAAATNGDLYAWKASGAELVDGDANPATVGILHRGLPIVAPPMLLDVNGGAPDVVIAEQQATSVRISLIDATGASVTPPSSLISPLWPASIPGQRAAPLAEMHVKDGATTTVGVAVASVDTTAARMTFTWIPATFTGATPATPPVIVSHSLGGAASLAAMPSAPAVGDIDHDGDDEAVVTTPAGKVVVLDVGSAFANDVTTQTGDLRAANPSAPALGDVDGDGVLEIAVWDESYVYLLKSNARPLLEWPRPIHPDTGGDTPPVRLVREFESPLLVDMNNDASMDVLFPLDDGTLWASLASGTSAPGFPRVGPAESGCAPAVAKLTTGGGYSLVALGSAGALRSVNSVIDSLGVNNQTTLSIQSLSGIGTSQWPMARVDLRRSGRVGTTSSVVKNVSAFDASSFIIYPNPVKAATVHARVNTSARATVSLSVLDLEGQEAITRSFTVNPNGLPNTPFDEAIDVAALKSGVYLMRLHIESPAGSGSVVKTFAIRR